MGEPLPSLRTARILLRPWTDDDLEPFARLNADPEVMRHFPAPLDRAASDALAGRIREGFARRGFGLWAVELPGEAPFLGFVGLSAPSFPLPVPRPPSPCIEVGWRLARAWWGRGLAPEAAAAALEFGFERAGLAEIVSFTAEINAPSRRVMEKIGMRRDPADDFDHPALPKGDPLRRHVLYRRGRNDPRRSPRVAARP